MMPILIMSNQFLDLVCDHSLLFLLNVRHHDWLAKIILLDWWLVFEGICVENELGIILIWRVLVFQHIHLLISFIITFTIFNRVCDARENVLLRVILYTLKLLNVNGVFNF